MANRLPIDEWFPAGVPGIRVRRVRDADGLTLRVLEAGPAAGPPVLLLHGWAVTAYLWRHNILALAAAGHRVVAPDLHGHGLSDAPAAPGSYRLEAFVRSVLGLMDALALPRAAIVAQSMAAKVAVQLAFDAPARVSRLVLFGAVGFGLVPPWRALAPLLPAPPGDLPSKLVPRQLVAFVQRRVYGKLGWFTERDVDEYWAPTQFPAVVRAALQMLREFPWSLWEAAPLARLTTPTHLIFGTRDRTVRPGQAKRLAAALPHGRLTWIVDGGHVVMEEVPDRVNAMLLADLAD
ncbi:MAG: alpha/beta hydrolase [Gemmatimonadaceae bacterium]